ncbi:hypothetical protein KUV51_03795 [Tateyamaria omphalii]|uniref:hypothetical protein n=1 Tax=Tateyamaria omphalii TaxID=299262 RepID=UPI001C996B19|nr:hypothetical protein [Tateyamaria omphalii]MBY5932110.1 hypothetical protein [Tateyamaria omphalii]
MTHHLRHVLAVLVLTWTCVSALPIVAHEGSHTPSMVARIDAATMLGHEFDLRLTLTGLGAPLMLKEMATPGALIRFQGPLTVGFAQDTVLIASVAFDGVPPDIFTLLLDFGASGQGAVTVIPQEAMH